MLRKAMLCMFLMVMAIGYSQVSIGSYRTKDRERFVPKLMSYQGYLTDTLGIPIDDTLNMTFNIYDNVSGGNLWWTETQTNIPIVRGVFSVILGTNNTIPDSVFIDGTDRWLELTLEGPVTLAPRTRMTSAGYAYMATYSDTAEYARNVNSDYDWERGTPDSVLFTVDFLGIARGNASNELLGNVHRQVNFGVSCTTGNSGAGSGDVAILSGWGCKADSAYGTIVNGVQNKARGQQCFIGSGQSNLALGQASAIVGGLENNTNGYRSFIGGGYSNVAGDFSNDTSAVVVGGWDNSVTNKFSFIGGGQGNSVSNFHATIGGGGDNSVLGYYASLLGGDGNTAAGPYTTVGGGRDIYAAGEYAAILGGFRNRTNATYATIGGGDLNYVEGQYSAILGGYADTIFSTANYSYLFGIRAKCTEDSTFMVDMPHIWFGDEMNGYEFPVDDGSANQVMKTDGSGQLAWTDVEDSDWTISGNDMYSNISGNVGIGTPTPLGDLTVADSTGQTSIHLSRPDSLYASTISFVTGGSYDWQLTNGSGSDNLYLSRGAGSSGNLYICGNAGNVGVGTQTPSNHKLNVVSYTGGYAAVRGADQSGASIYAEGQLGVLSATGMPYNPTNIGVLGIKPNAGSDGVAVYGYNNDNGGTSYAVYAACDGISTNNYGIYASATNASTNNWAGYFVGDVNIDGDLTISGAVPEDNDWTRGTPDSVLFTSNLVGIARGDANNVFYGDSAYTHINLGVVCTTGTTNPSTQHITIGGGYGNKAMWNYSTVGGGFSNVTHGSYGTIVGGRDNNANIYSFVGGGQENSAGPNIANYISIGGGRADTVMGRYGSILGGYDNLAGDENIDTAVVVVGGRNNSATAKYAFVGGGKSNTSSAEYGVIAGGNANTINEEYSVICGGYNNTTNGHRAFIGGGYGNSTGTDYHSYIGNGYVNYNAGYCSAIPCGYRDSITTNADYSMAFGNYVYVNDDHFVIFYDGSNSGCFWINADHHDIAPGNWPIVVGTNTTNGNTAYLSATGVWSDGSFDRNRFSLQAVNKTNLLKKIKSIPVFIYKTTDSKEQHILPDVERFYDEFYCGSGQADFDKKHISATDMAGVSLAAIQELTMLIEEVQEENAELKKRLEILEEKTRFLDQ